MGFDALTSFTGGGGLSAPSSASADGDNYFTNGGFSYNSAPKNDNTMIIVIAAVAMFAVYMVAK